MTTFSRVISGQLDLQK